MHLKMFLVGFEDSNSTGNRTVMFAPSFEAMIKIAKTNRLVIIRELHPNGFTIMDEPQHPIGDPDDLDNDFGL